MCPRSTTSERYDNRILKTAFVPSWSIDGVRVQTSKRNFIILLLLFTAQGSILVLLRIVPTFNYLILNKSIKTKNIDQNKDWKNSFQVGLESYPHL